MCYAPTGAATAVVYTMLMLLLHIIIALTSIIYSTVMVLSPSARKLRVNYALIALTLTTGTYLVVSTHAALLSSCVSGLCYLAVVLLGTVATRRKLVHIAA